MTPFNGKMILNPFIPLVDCRGVVKVNRAFVIRCQVKVINTKISIILPRISYSIILDFYFVIIEFFSLQKIFNGILLPKLFLPTVRKHVLVIEKNFWNSRLKAENYEITKGQLISKELFGDLIPQFFQKTNDTIPLN